LHKLAVIRDEPVVGELMRCLEEAGIEAVCHGEANIGATYFGGAPWVAVWIKDPGDMERATQILRDVQAQRTFARCPGCGYDLRGHTGETACPECGLELTAGCPEVECPHCGELVPGDFEVCWNCGAEVPAPGDRDA
jgi:hypothetical protein